MAQRPSELNQTDEKLEKIATDNTEIETRSTASIDNPSEQSFESVAGNAVASAEDAETDDTVQIREQIEQTRSQMSETINAIEEKLSFANISNQVSEQFSNVVESAKSAAVDATLKKAEKIMKTVNKGFNEFSESAGEVGTYVVETARRNPLPFALIGLGVGMLLVQRSLSDSNTGKKTDKKYYKSKQGNSTFRQFTDTGSHALASAQKKVSSAAGSAYETVSSAAETAYDSVSNVAGSAYEGVTGAASSAYQGVSHFASSTGDQVQSVAKKAQEQYAHTLEENPLALGAVALAVGAVVGLSIPSTEYENNLMGETRQQLVQTVEDSARDAFSKVQEVAGEFAKTATEQVKATAKG